MGLKFRIFVVGVITMLFSDYSCAMVLVDQWTNDSEGKQHRVSFQWLDESNEGAPFSSLSCPATACVLAWVYPYKNFAWSSSAGALENHKI